MIRGAIAFATAGCVFVGCSSTGAPSGDDGVSPGGPDGGEPSARDGGGASTGDGDAGGAPLCAPVCGGAGAPGPARGLASDAPAGCSSAGAFERSWWRELPTDAGKSIPMFADFDGDGALDLVVNPRLGDATAYRGNGDGTFGAGVPLPAGAAGGWGIDVGDFAGDGHPDVLAGDHIGGARAWRTAGGMTFTDVSAGLPDGTFNGAGLADLDGDGDLDAIFGADQFASGFAVAFGDGAGGWTTKPVDGLPAYGNGSDGITDAGYFAFADHDGDGDLDLFVFGQRPGLYITAFVFDNDGTGTHWTPRAELAGGDDISWGYPLQGSIGDIDCDGAVDLAVGARLFLSDGSGGWLPGPQPSQSKIAHLGDLDGDGRLDLVVQSGPTQSVQAFRNNGPTGFSAMSLGLPDASYVPPGFTPETIDDPIQRSYGIDLADIDGDGDLDLVRTFKADAGWLDERTLLEVWVRR